MSFLSQFFNINFYNKFIKLSFKNLKYFIFVQVFLFCVSLPILTNWGLPFSWLSLLGNLFFTPFLVIYLCLSFFIFFAQILGLPNIYLINILEFLTSFWLFIISHANSGVIFYLPKLFCINILIFLILVFAIVSLNKFNIKNKILLLLGVILINIFIIKNYYLNNNFIAIVSCGNKKLLLLKIKNKNILIDNKALSRCRDIEQWVRFVLINTLSAETGRPVVDLLVILNPTESSIKKGDLLNKLGHVKSVKYINKKFDKQVNS